MAKKLYGAALAARQKKQAKNRRKSAKKEGKTMAKKRRRSGGSKKRRSGGRRSGGFISKKDAMLAGGVALGYGFLQHKAEKAKVDEMKWFKEAPTITPLGRAGTFAAAAFVAWKWGRVRIAKPIALGLGAVALAQVGRRGLKLYEDADTKSIMSGGDEAALYLEGADDDAVEVVDVEA